MQQPSTLSGLILQLCEVGEMSVKGGLVLASGGNLSARLPGSEVFAVTGSGTWLDRLTPDDFAIMNLEGALLSGPAPSSEWKLHQRTYQVRPDVNSVIHLHPQHAVLLDALGHKIRLITLDHAYYVKSVGSVPYYPNGSDELADLSAEQCLEHNCLILSNHGCSAIGPDISMAYRRALNLEEASIATFRALCLGDAATTFPPESFADLHHS
ncbi:MAG: class II aldolase/adducin family protein [Propionibacteriaceae bacterium]|nr:class II aldolase/adducin family protein [Propionibacteriaceae bacterium]